AAWPVVVVPFRKTASSIAIAVGAVASRFASAVPRALSRITVALGPAAVPIVSRLIEPATARRVFISEPRPHFVARSVHRPAPVLLAVVVGHLLTVAVIP